MLKVTKILYKTAEKMKQRAVREWIPGKKKPRFPGA